MMIFYFSMEVVFGLVYFMKEGRFDVLHHLSNSHLLLWDLRGGVERILNHAIEIYIENYTSIPYHSIIAAITLYCIQQSPPYCNAIGNCGQQYQKTDFCHKNMGNIWRKSIIHWIGEKSGLPNKCVWAFSWRPRSSIFVFTLRLRKSWSWSFPQLMRSCSPWPPNRKALHIWVSYWLFYL